MATPNPTSNNNSQLEEHDAGADDVLTQPATPEQSPKTPQTANTPTEMPPLKRTRTMRCLFLGEHIFGNPNKHLDQIGLPLGCLPGCSKILETISPVNSTKYNPDLVLVESTDEDEQPPNPKRARE